MSDGLQIDHGGAIAVDTEVLRGVGSRMLALAGGLSEAQAAIRRAQSVVACVAVLSEHVDGAALRRSADRVGDMLTETQEAAAATLFMADAFEVVELRARVEALRIADAAGAAAVQERLDGLLASDGRLGLLADRLVSDWQDERFEGLALSSAVTMPVPQIVLTGGVFALMSGLGKVRTGARLTGAADAVAVRPVRTTAPTGPPTSLADALRRFPKGPGAQVGVERYAMPDGRQQFAVYVKGTQSVAFGGDEPWDMRSNTQLYTGERSASYQATLDALEKSGAKPGDRVLVVGHSQGALVGAHLAMESGYEVPLLLTAGAPVEPTVGEGQLVVQLRHTDDIVSSLAGGGSAEGTGSPDSFTARRVVDPGFGPNDFTLHSHGHDQYVETAEMVDASGDPRLNALDRVWADLEGATEITSTDYRAQRVDAPAGGSVDGP